MPTAARNAELREWHLRYRRATKALRSAHEAIEFLSALAGADVHAKICFASNALRGGEAQLREAADLFHKGAAS